MQAERHQRQLPRIDRHDDQHGNYLDRVDDPRHGAPLGELGEGLHIAGHPGRQHALAGRRVLGEAETVQVPEGAHPQAVEHVLSRSDQPEVRDPTQLDAADDQHGGSAGEDQDPTHAHAVGGHRPVQHRLDGERDEQLGACDCQGHQGGEDQPIAQFRRGGQSASQDGEGARRPDLVGGFGGRAPVDVAHRPASSYARARVA